ncbi:hypothetical protein BRADI_1g03954v3, partial [Brachypodium distachyon]
PRISCLPPSPARPPSAQFFTPPIDLSSIPENYIIDRRKIEPRSTGPPHPSAPHCQRRRAPYFAASVNPGLCRRRRTRPVKPPAIHTPSPRTPLPTSPSVVASAAAQPAPVALS